MTAIDTTDARVTATDRVRVARDVTELAATAETTGVPGLGITPTRRGTRWTGQFDLLHVASGWPLVGDLPLVYVRELAAAVADLPVDWTAPVGQVRAGGGRQVLELGHAARSAWSRGEPLRWARESWHECPPVWRMRDLLDDNDEPVDREWTSREALDAWLAPLTEWLTDPKRAAATPVLDTRPAWQLVCAAPLCVSPSGKGPTVAGWFDQEIDDWDTTPTANRRELAAQATDAGWAIRRCGQCWLCPTCAYEHTRNLNAF